MRLVQSLAACMIASYLLSDCGVDVRDTDVRGAVHSPVPSVNHPTSNSNCSIPENEAKRMQLGNGELSESRCNPDTIQPIRWH